MRTREITLVGRDASITAERRVFTVVTSLDPADSALADSLGWQAGVPQAEVLQEIEHTKTQAR